ncbi:MAG: flippase-like domain-containing protein [Burkholderiales bacterium]|nr:flippase-like domain-containing protein [Burkholderiales bacterium]
MPDKIIFVVKLSISAFIVYLIAGRIDVEQVKLTLRHANVYYLCLSVLVAALAVPAVSMRWAMVARIFSIDLSNTTAVKATFAGLFVGQVLPGAIGADIVRGWMIWHLGMRKKMIVASLIADRVISLVAVGLMILIGLPFLARYAPQYESLLNKLSLVGLAFFVASIFALHKTITHARAMNSLTILRNKFSIKNISISTRKVLSLILLANFGHLLFILSAYSIGIAMNIKAEFWVWCIIIPIVSLVSAMPVSINGWGVREFAMIELWSIFGISSSDAFLVSVSVGIVSVISSLPGVCYWVSSRGAGKLLQERG